MLLVRPSLQVILSRDTDDRSAQICYRPAMTIRRQSGSSHGRALNTGWNDRFEYVHPTAAGWQLKRTTTLSTNSDLACTYPLLATDARRSSGDTLKPGHCRSDRPSRASLIGRSHDQQRHGGACMSRFLLLNRGRCLFQIQQSRFVTSQPAHLFLSPDRHSLRVKPLSLGFQDCAGLTVMRLVGLLRPGAGSVHLAAVFVRSIGSPVCRWLVGRVRWFVLRLLAHGDECVASSTNAAIVYEFRFEEAMGWKSGRQMG